MENALGLQFSLQTIFYQSLCLQFSASIFGTFNTEAAESNPRLFSNQNLSSYIEYSWSSIGKSSQQRLEVYIQFQSKKTRLSSSSILIYVETHKKSSQRNDFLAIGIQNDHAILMFDLGGGTSIIKSDSNLSSASHKWHSITAGFSGEHGYLITNSQPMKHSEVCCMYSSLDEMNVLYLGGVPDFHKLPEIVSKYFNGGFHGIIYNAAARTNDARFHSLLFDSGQSDGIPMKGLFHVENSEKQTCVSSDCRNSGVCSENGFECICTSSFKGVECNENVLPCVEYNPCKPGSVCRIDGFTLKCDCPFGWTGVFCSQKVVISAPYLAGDSFMVVQPRNISHVVSLIIHFKSQALNGVLFYVTGEDRDFFAITLYKGFVYTRFNLGTATISVRSHKRITTSQKHTLHIYRKYHKAVMKLDNNTYVGVRGSQLSKLLDVGKMFLIGGVPDFSVVNKNAFRDSNAAAGFKGCILYLEVNQHNYILNSSNYKNLSGRNIRECHTSCINDLCANDATCVGNDTSYTCACRLGFTGRHCEQKLTSSVTSGYFNRSSYWMTTLQNNSNNFEFAFRSSRPEGVLLWYGHLHDHRNMFSVGLVNGYINVRYRVTGREVSSTTSQRFDDGRFHKLHVSWFGYSIHLWVDINKPEILVNPPPIFMRNTDADIYIGGLPGNVTKLTGSRYRRGLQGCIANATLTNTKDYIDFASVVRSKGQSVGKCHFNT